MKRLESKESECSYRIYICCVKEDKKRMQLTKNLLCLSLMQAFALSAVAIDLGRPLMLSKQGEPLKIDIPISAINPEELKDLQVGIAPSKTGVLKRPAASMLKRATAAVQPPKDLPESQHGRKLRRGERGPDWADRWGPVLRICDLGRIRSRRSNRP
jgi:hypothetical protein